MRARFSRWDGSQTAAADINVGELLDEMSDELLSGYGPRWALRELQRRGVKGSRGLDSMIRRLREERRSIEETMNLSGPLQEVRRELDEILSLERRELAQAPSAAEEKQAHLDALPPQLAGAIRDLMSYEFTSKEAGRRFEALSQKLRAEVLNAYFKDLAGAMRDVTPEQMALLKDMLAELNDMIGARERGDDYDFEAFMQRYGQFFPENPQNLAELLEIMARRMTAMSRLLGSLSPDQRRELAELASSVLEDMDLAWQMDRLTQSLRTLMPNLPWGDPVADSGDGEMPMSAAVQAIERVSELEALEHAMAGDYAGASLDDIDEEELRRSLGDDAVRDLRRLKEIERALESAGVVDRRRGRLELTARGARLLGERSLTRVLERIRREPTHRSPGGEAEATGQTRPWVFGDDEPISVERTIHNAVLRSGPTRRVRISGEDFEVMETESRPRTATALLLDLSFSMPLRGHWIPAKTMALALHSLIDSKYPQDKLYLIGFSDYARQMEAADLASVGWEKVQGTNMQHAFMLARRVLDDDPRTIKQVIMVTDGEPTAHLEDDYALFNWPPIPATIEKTLRESMRLARSNVAINVFLLDSSLRLQAFMERLARLTGGQVFPATNTDIGGTVISRYLDARRRAS